MPKMDEARFESCIEDSPEQIQKCINCPMDECINCVDYVHDPFEELVMSIELMKERKKKIKKLTKSERAVLRFYPYATTDVDLSRMSGVTQSMVCNTRKKLCLPIIRITSQDMRKKFVALWLEDEVPT